MDETIHLTYIEINYIINNRELVGNDLKTGSHDSVLKI